MATIAGMTAGYSSNSSRPQRHCSTPRRRSWTTSSSLTPRQRRRAEGESCHGHDPCETVSLRLRGDGGPATAPKRFNDPMAVAVPRAGNVFLADSQNNCLREVNHSTGIIPTVAGNERVRRRRNRSGGGALRPRRGGAQVISTSPSRLVRFPRRTCLPRRVREVNLATGIITTVAGNGSPSYGGDRRTTTASVPPAARASNAAGNLFIADPIPTSAFARSTPSPQEEACARGCGRMAGFTATADRPRTLSFLLPYSADPNAAGDLFISDSINECVREVSRTRRPASLPRLPEMVPEALLATAARPPPRNSIPG